MTYGAERLVLSVGGDGAQQAEHQQVVVDAAQGQPLRRLTETSCLHVL